MQSKDKYSLLRTILKALGLSAEAIDDIIDRIADFLSDKDEKSSEKLEYPYFVRDDFLSPAEHSFVMVLRSTVADSTLVCPKVALGDLFFVKSSDASKYRSYTNKIDRKHIDFLLCDPKTGHPIIGIELDDKSHQQSNRLARDEFVGNVFEAAKLPLIRIPVKHAYSTTELAVLLGPYFGKPETIPQSPQVAPISDKPPRCPKCGSEMVLRTAKSGANQGERFWGCPNFPRCRGFLNYASSSK
jgi:hypothetical protein